MAHLVDNRQLSDQDIEDGTKHSDIDSSSNNENNARSKNLYCNNCSSFLGSPSLDPSQPSYRLYKSRLSINSTSYPSTTFIGAQLLQLIESSISRRIVLHANTTTSSSPTPGILAWIFNPDIYYSSSRSPSNPSVIRAMKVLYKCLPNPLELLDSPTSNVEELLVPQPELDAFRSALEATKEILPLSARTFKLGSDEWSVGLVERWESSPSGMQMMDGNVLNKKAPDEIKLKMNEVPEGWSELFA
jgi:hypothetical protein